MKDEAREFLRIEHDTLFKMAYESQFNHFMGVFYFWIAVVTFPGTAGLIANSATLDNEQFGWLLALIATVGVFLSAKMYDIRCSQLKYIVKINEVRYQLHAEVKADFSKDYNATFNWSRSLRNVALTDFGMAMAIVMSLVNGAYSFVAASLLGNAKYCSVLVGCGIGLLSLGLYIAFVLKKVPEQSLQHEPSSQSTHSARDS